MRACASLRGCRGREDRGRGRTGSLLLHDPLPTPPRGLFSGLPSTLPPVGDQTVNLLCPQTWNLFSFFTFILKLILQYSLPAFPPAPLVRGVHSCLCWAGGSRQEWRSPMESQFFKTGGVNESPHRFVEILKWEKVICACMISMCKHTFTTYVYRYMYVYHV